MYVLYQSIPVQFLVSWLLIYLGRRIFGAKSTVSRIVTIVVLLELSMLVFTIAFAKVLPQGVLDTLRRICNAWYFGQIYAGLMGLITLFYGWIDRLLKGPFSRLSDRVRSLSRKGLVIVGILASIGIVGYGHYRTSHPIVKHLRIAVDKPHPTGRDSVRIALITDLHMSECITPKHVERMAALVEEAAPDVMLVGGDIFDFESLYGYHPRNMATLRRLARNIPEGVYYVMGNHEYRGDTERKIAWVDSVGSILLIDEVAQLSFGQLVGRDDAIRKQRKNLSALTAQTDPSQLRILLEHTPKQLDSVAYYGYDLAFYGHTHLGQIIPFKWVIQLYWPLAYGSRQVGHTHYYVSSGVGAAGLAMRVGTYSEVVIIDVLFGKAS